MFDNTRAIGSNAPLDTLQIRFVHRIPSHISRTSTGRVQVDLGNPIPPSAPRPSPGRYHTASRSRHAKGAAFHEVTIRNYC